MRTKASGQGLKSSLSLSVNNKDSMVFSAIDNRTATTSTRIFKSIQPDKKNAPVSKENRNTHAFVTSAYDQSTFHSSSSNRHPRPFYKHIPQTFTTNLNHEKALPTTTHRPTMGGKTISAIHHLPATTVIRHHNRMSSQELKLLSRRINPHEPLSSPHASPSKPPLPNILQSRKRQRQQSPPPPANKVAKIDDDEIAAATQFVCEPCNKKYKTRNGFTYHSERCKYLKFETTIAKAIIKCICDDPTDDSGTMIECTKCNTWLHIKCAGGVTNESSYCCPRCCTLVEEEEEEKSLADDDDNTAFERQQQPEDEEDDDSHLLHNGRTIKLSELCQAKERGKNLLQSFKETAEEQEPEKPSRNEFNFISLFSDDLVLTEEPSTTGISTAQWEDEFPSTTDVDFSSNDWANDVPSLLFSDNNEPASSFMDDFPSDLLSSPTVMPQSDWLHFANFEVDFTATEQDQQDL